MVDNPHRKHISQIKGIAMKKGTSYAPQHGGQVVTVEKTAKRFKLAKLLSALMMIVGIILAIVNNDTPDSSGFIIGVILIPLGLVWRILTGIRIWWHHS